LATAVLAAVVAMSCSSMKPWRNEPVGNEINLAFSLERNLIELPNVRIDNRPGRFILGTAAPRTVIDPTLVRAASVTLGEKSVVRIRPAIVDLQGVADAIIGADAWGANAITIDYQKRVLTFQKYAMESDGMSVSHFRGEPSVEVVVDGRRTSAIVDTTSPDTLVLPAATKSRGTASVRVADADFGAIDVQYANVARARIGNRLLSRFLVTIDYGRHMVGLWRDPRA
jgi:hypothetical protein